MTQTCLDSEQCVEEAAAPETRLDQSLRENEQYGAKDVIPESMSRSR